MAHSRNNKFFIEVKDDNRKTFSIIPSLEKDSDGTIIAQPDQNFVIKLKSENPDTRYSAQLIIDGQIAVKQNLFTNIGFFNGFKKGNNEYDTFQFSKAICGQSNSNESLKNQSKQMGEIRILFFNTQRRLVPKRVFRPTGTDNTQNKVFKPTGTDSTQKNSENPENDKQRSKSVQNQSSGINYEPVCSFETKIPERSLSISTGRTFVREPVNPEKIQKYFVDEETGMSIYYDLIWDEVIDQVI